MPALLGIRYNYHVAMTLKTKDATPTPTAEAVCEELLAGIQHCSVLGFDCEVAAHSFQECRQCKDWCHRPADTDSVAATESVEQPPTEFMELAKKTAKIVVEKNAAYGQSFAKSGDILRCLYPKGVQANQYDDMLAIIRIIDKLFRVATGGGDSKEDAARDITGYGLLMQHRNATQVKK